MCVEKTQRNFHERIEIKMNTMILRRQEIVECFHDLLQQLYEIS